MFPVNGRVMEKKVKNKVKEGLVHFTVFRLVGMIVIDSLYYY